MIGPEEPPDTITVDLSEFGAGEVTMPRWTVHTHTPTVFMMTKAEINPTRWLFGGDKVWVDFVDGEWSHVIPERSKEIFFENGSFNSFFGAPVVYISTIPHDAVIVEGYRGSYIYIGKHDSF